MTCTTAPMTEKGGTPAVNLATAEEARGGGDSGGRGAEDKQSLARWQRRVPAGNSGPGAAGVARAACVQTMGLVPKSEDMEQNPAPGLAPGASQAAGPRRSRVLSRSQHGKRDSARSVVHGGDRTS